MRNTRFEMRLLHMNVGQENSESVNLSYEDHGPGPPVVFIIQGDDDRILPFPITGKRLPEALIQPMPLFVLHMHVFVELTSYRIEGIRAIKLVGK